MTEEEWLACTEPNKMLAFLRGNFPYRVSPFLRSQVGRRKLRLFVCACCRRIWHLLTDERSRAAVEAGERHAEGETTWRELEQFRLAAREAYQRALATSEDEYGDAYWVAPRAAAWATYQNYPIAREYAGQTASDTVWAAGSAGADRNAERRSQCHLLRDIFGNPFRPATTELAWLAWNDAAVAKVAHHIYEERRFGDMPILADALEDAGCTNADILNHCRQPGEHVRGCWVLDLLLGKE